jgi:hypothetical protein
VNAEADQTYPDIIRDWWGVPTKFRADTHGKYATASLNEYMVYIAMMLCRLFERKAPLISLRHGCLFFMKQLKVLVSTRTKSY